MKKILILLLLCLGLAWLIIPEYRSKPERKSRTHQAIPVEITEIQRGTIQQLRTFTGTLEAYSQFIIAPRIAGRLKTLSVDIADTVNRNQVIAELDNAEYIQAVTQAQANLEMAKAELKEADSLLTLTQRKLERIDTIQKRGLSSESEYDITKAEYLTQQAQVAVSKAKVKQASALLALSNIQLDYTQIRAEWTGGNDQAYVAERYIDKGTIVSANTPLIQVIELDPITAVFFVTEPDYTLLYPKQKVSIRTDVYANTTFYGEIERIAPVFSKNTHQARVELRIDNSTLQLKPGMLVHITIILQEITDTLIIPVSALTTHNNKQGIFLLSKDEKSVIWQEIQTGIQQGEQIQILNDALIENQELSVGNKVVTLGQQLLDNGSSVTLFESTP